MTKPTTDTKCAIDAYARHDDAPGTLYPTLCGREVTIDDASLYTNATTCSGCVAYLDDVDIDVDVDNYGRFDYERFDHETLIEMHS